MGTMNTAKNAAKCNICAAIKKALFVVLRLDMRPTKKNAWLKCVFGTSKILSKNESMDDSTTRPTKQNMLLALGYENRT